MRLQRLRRAAAGFLRRVANRLYPEVGSVGHYVHATGLDKPLQERMRGVREELRIQIRAESMRLPPPEKLQIRDYGA